MSDRLSTKEAAQLLGVFRTAVHEHRKAGRLVAYFAGTDDPVSPDANLQGVPTKVEFDRDAVLALRKPKQPLIPLAPSGGSCQVFADKHGHRAAFDLFFPPDEDEQGNTVRPDYRPALKMCFGCPIRLKCLHYAAKAGITEGCCGGARPAHLEAFAKAWRNDSELPSICHWCHKPYLVSSGHSALWCRSVCAAAGEAAGGFDPTTPTPNRGTTKP